MDAVAALHRDARSWHQHADAEAAWLVLRSLAIWSPPGERTWQALRMTSERLALLAARLRLAADDEATLADLDWTQEVP